ncbi:MAG: AraC family transcriptional regulator [Phycisphaeraceae bacterium]
MGARRRKAEMVHIERYLGADTPLAELPALGRSRQSMARPLLAAHAHEVYEICLIRRGAVQWFVEDRDHTLGPGMVFFCRPGQLHGSRAGVLEPCDLAWLQFDHRARPQRDLVRSLRGIDGTAWKGSGELFDCHERLLAECRQRRPDAALMCRAILTQFLLTLIRQPRGEEANGGVSLPPAVRRVVELIQQQPGERWTLESLRRHAGVSRTRLHALFQKHLGQSPGQYALRHRLRQAQLALRLTRRPITQIALEHGFSSSQHFATNFRRAFGMTPRECRSRPGL